MAGFSPTITSHRKMPERFWIPLDFRCRRWRPAKLRGHSVSSALPCISFHNRAEGTAGTFQRGKVSEPALHPETRFSIAQPQALLTPQQNSQHTASLDVLAEPNYYSKSLQTSSTRVFASHCRRTMEQLDRHSPRCFARAACRFRFQPLHYKFSNSFDGSPCVISLRTAGTRH